MRIVIDARMYGLEHAGIGRYVMNLINQIGELDKKNNYFLLLREKYFQGLKFKNRRLKKVRADYPHYSLKEQILLPLQLIKLKADLVHFPHFNTPLLWWGKQVTTIHDLIKHESRGVATTTRSGLVYWLKYLAYKLIVWLTIKKAKRIIVPSQWWQEELIRRYRLASEKVVVTYEGVDEKLKPGQDGKVLRKYGIKKPFVIYTGSLYPHKNIERLVRAVKQAGIVLVVVCARNVFYERFEKKIIKMKAEKFVNLVGFVPDEDLGTLYQEAEAFVFPSLLEGFGLPGLEAMSVGCPVIASNIPVLKEVYGEAALYFDPYKIEEMAVKIKEVTGDQNLRAELREKGLVQVKKYSWQKMAKETLKVYEDSSRL